MIELVIKSTILLAVLLAATTTAHGKVVFKDPFTVGKSFDPSDSDSDYFYFAFDPDAGFFANDGEVVQGTTTVTEIANPFTITFEQSDIGGLDHVKTLQYNKEYFISDPDPVVRYTLTLSGETFGTENHPFGAAAVTDEQDDIRLAGVGCNAADFNTFIVADFILTNTGVWALYERLPFGKGTPELGDYRAFTSTKRVGNRSPDDIHTVSIEYDKEAGEIRWIYEDQVVMLVDEIGVPSPDPDVKLILDHGGTDTIVAPIGLNFGFGLFTLLDMWDPNTDGSDKTGLVKLSTLPDFYVAPDNFVDESSLEGSRLFGQGAKLVLYDATVQYL